jgi:pyruvate dehydrogenase E2 component (dihydrolipoamide acetyltransferase)
LEAEDATSVLPWRQRGSRPRDRSGRAFLSPAVRRLVAEHDLDPAKIAGTGAEGRVTRNDVLEAGAHPPEPREQVKDETIPFSPVRKRIAEHMVRSKAISPHAAIVVEVDFDRVARVRRTQTGLSYLPFVARAVVDAIGEYPRVNASVGDDELIVHRDVHLGIAVDLDFQGLIVPVIRDAGTKPLSTIAAEVTDLADRARRRRLSPDDVVGGTFTITNPGPYGTAISVPVINQPQVAILATDRVVLRPVIVEDANGVSIAMHPVGRLTLTFDHRACDGAYAAGFVSRVGEIVETRAWDSEL